MSKIIKKIHMVIVVLTMSSGFAYAEMMPMNNVSEKPKNPQEHNAGYSYFAIGFENVEYREKASIVGVNSKAKITNPVLMTGGLFHVNDDWDFTIQAESSLFPQGNEESWDVRGNETVRGLTAANNPIQTNQFTLTNSSTRVTALYKYLPKWRITSGLEYHLITFKRYTFKTNYPNSIAISSGVVEESVGIVNLSVGGQYESATRLSEQLRYMVGFSLDTPLYKKTINTNAPDTVFNSRKGWGLNTSFGISYQIIPQLHGGLLLGYDYRFANSQVIANTEVPENKTTTLKGAFAIVYKF